MLFHEYIAREDGDEEKPRRLEVGYRRVRLPNHPDELRLVVVKGFGREPMMLLTNLRLKRSRKCIWHIVEAYLTRLADRGDDPLYEAELSAGGHPGLKYSRLQNMMVL